MIPAEFFEFAKTVPADLLISLSNVTVIELNPKFSALYLDNYYLEVQPNQGALAHELGHGEDWLNQNIDYLGKINGNYQVTQIYTKELEKFNKENPAAFQDVIAYFSKTGGSHSTGLSEIVADTYALMSTYGHTREDLSLRINYLTKYFPETVAKIAELAGYNQVENK